MPKGILLSLLITAIGVAWLLNTLHFIGGVDWAWTISLAAIGIVVLAWGGINKVSVIFGGMLLIASILSVLRQTGNITFEVEVPILVIVLGALFMVAQHPMIPLPRAIIQFKEEAKRHDPQ